MKDFFQQRKVVVIVKYTNFERVIKLAAKDTDKGARVVAKMFYQILRRNGFTEDKIISISTNILNCLTESLKGYEKKIENKVEKNKESSTKNKDNMQNTDKGRKGFYQKHY